jgi:WhiB family transcriptional regulator, redox-sensing transcriptional regulator
MTAVGDVTDWRARGACIAADPDLFFPVSAAGLSLRQEQRAKAVCGGCQVRPECLRYALGTDQVFGVWGGHTAEELARLRRNRKRANRRRAALLTARLAQP